MLKGFVIIYVCSCTAFFQAHNYMDALLPRIKQDVIIPIIPIQKKLFEKTSFFSEQTYPIWVAYSFKSMH